MAAFPRTRTNFAGGAGYSRRAFLKGSGVSAATTIMLDTAVDRLSASEAQADDVGVVGRGTGTITLDVNGQEHLVSVEPRETLVEVLRDKLGLTGTKIGCDRGACSACTVWLDGVPVTSCMLLAIDVGGRKVATIEGLAKGDDLHAVQAAFIAHDAIQCGYCTPGMIMSAIDIVHRYGGKLDEETVRHELEGNICRCTGYHNIVKAVLDAASRMQVAQAAE